MSTLTKFQQRERLLDEWFVGGQQGERPEWPVYRNCGVSAMIDPYSDRRYGVVIYPHEPKRHLWELDPVLYMKVGLVARAVGQRILDLTGEEAFYTEGAPEPRAVARVDGRQVPGHCHIVMGASMQRDETPFVWPNDPAERAFELYARWQALGFSVKERNAMSGQLRVVEGIAPNVDFPVLDRRES